jgi:hypothetical protein
MELNSSKDRAIHEEDDFSIWNAFEEFYLDKTVIFQTVHSDCLIFDGFCKTSKVGTLIPKTDKVCNRYLVQRPFPCDVHFINDR